MSVAEDLAEVWNEAEARRGRRWAYPELDGARTALIVVGLTRGLLQQAPRAQGPLARLEALAEILRRAGGRVLWARPDASPPPAGLALAQGLGRATAAQDEFAPEAPRKPGDQTLRIRPPSVFFPGASLAPHVLREAGIKRLIFAGGLTHLEVESSLRDAVSAGFQCLVAADCCLDRTPEANLASLRAMHRSFADVRPSQDLGGLLRRNIGMSAEDAEDMVEEAFQAASAATSGSGAVSVAAAVWMASAPKTEVPQLPPASPEPAPPQAARLGFAALAAPEASGEEPAKEAPAKEAEETGEDSAGEPSMEEILEAIRRSDAFRRMQDDDEPEEGRRSGPGLRPQASAGRGG